MPKTTRRRKPVDEPEMTTPMFHMLPQPERGDERTKTQRSATSAACSQCSKEKVGLLAINGHYVWRAHTYRTWGGASVSCQASNVRLCVAAARVIPHKPTPGCPCGEH